MPGIVGFTTSAINKADCKRTLQEMQELITHDRSYKKDELFCAEHMCATRSHTDIVDRAPQPYSESGIYVWLEGEFYNQAELSGRTGVASSTDPALLASLFRRSPDLSFLKNIDGIFSAVIYDSAQQKVYLVTDRYGLQYMYWTLHGGGLAWGSEVKAMLALPGFKPKIDRQATDEFLSIGYLLEDRTWFEGVELLSPGSVLIWDLEERSAERYRYWWWDSIVTLGERVDLVDAAEELARIFKKAVEERSGPSDRVGASLSGGLDSRAVLAAIPDYGKPVPSVTFGKDRSADVKIARMAAAVRGSPHYTMSLSGDNWLMPRLRGVWYTDGQFDLMNMHGFESAGEMKALFDICMSGFLGDTMLGGSKLKNKEFFDVVNKNHIAAMMGCSPDLLGNFNLYANLTKSDYYIFQNRLRRYINLGVTLLQTAIVYRRPFCSNKLVEFAYSLPDSLRFHNKLYRVMLLDAFPEYFRTIPWQSSGVPISWPQWAAKAAKVLNMAKSRGVGTLNRLGVRLSDPYHYTDYPNWIRQEPASSFFQGLLASPSALYPEYISETEVRSRLEKHLEGADFAIDLCRYLTFELWLQQVFEGKYREVDES